MDIKNMKVSIGIVVAIIVQAFGLIWYVAQLDSTVSNNTETIKTEQDIRHNTLDELELRVNGLEERIDELEKIAAIIENEMRTIMSAHENIGKALDDLGKGSYSDNRQYGNYGD